MPELPEVETVRRGLAPAMVGAVIEEVEQRRPDLRFPFPLRFRERLTGKRVETLDRRAKYLVAALSSGEALIMHLGMSGRFTVHQGQGQDRASAEPGGFYYDQGPASVHDHVVLALSNGARITYNDARRFGFMDLVPLSGLDGSRHFKGLGLEPLGDGLTGDTIAALFHGKKTPLKAALLDQSLIAGLGNIYVSEALFRAGLHPEAPAGIVSTARGGPKPVAHRLAVAIREVLEEAVAVGGSTLRDHALTDGSLGLFQHRFRVYDRAGGACLTPGCTGAVIRLVQSGRSTYFCARCQPKRPRR